ncbi:MAG: hypothetical protein FJ115_08495 [Deltaproteobacteria bacterium]|nr:hypothetical protein [Deltaproteobacteria bacterium]
MKHFASPAFWECYGRLPANVQKQADRCFELLKTNPRHPSFHFKTVGKYCSVRIGLHYRALAVEVSGGLVWFWIGSHSDYDKMMD